MPSQIVRIDAANSDLLSHVAEDVFDHPIDMARLVAYCARLDTVMFVAVAEGQVVGQARAFVHAHPDAPDEFYIDNLGVTPSHQRRGIATRLMQALIAEGERLGCAEFWVATEAHNQEAVAFYRTLDLYQSDVVMFANFEDD